MEAGRGQWSRWLRESGGVGWMLTRIPVWARICPCLCTSISSGSFILHLPNLHYHRSAARTIDLTRYIHAILAMTHSQPYHFVPQVFEQDDVKPAGQMDDVKPILHAARTFSRPANVPSRPILSGSIEFSVPLLPSSFSVSSDFQSNRPLAEPLSPVRAASTSFPSTECLLPAPRPRAPIRTAVLESQALQQFITEWSAHVPVSSQFTEATLQDAPSQRLPTSADDDLLVPTLKLEDVCNTEVTADDDVSSGYLDPAYEHLAPQPSDYDPYADFTPLEYTPGSPSLKNLSPVGSLELGCAFKTSSPLEDTRMTDRLSPQAYSLLDSADALEDNKAFIGIYADINLRQRAILDKEPVGCVNPAEIIGETFIKVDRSPSPLLDEGRLVSPPDSPMDATSSQDGSHMDVDFPAEAISAIVSLLTTAKQEPLDAPAAVVLHSPPAPDAYTFQFQADPLYAHRQPLADIQAPNPAYCTNCTSAPVVPQSPVLNAHLGVPLHDLRRRADNFRQCNPGLELDRAWLQSFAGRLSQRGELIEEYRCYVTDCDQRNKRRDHILVHVGSHVEHRPWQCGEWCVVLAFFW